MLTVHVLNLSRRRDRREAFLRCNAHQELDIKFVEAVDGRQLQFADLVRNGIVVERAAHFTAGHIGCACSHKMMWEQTVREDRPIFVCEDDAVLRRDFVGASQQVVAQLGR